MLEKKDCELSSPPLHYLLVQLLTDVPRLDLPARRTDTFALWYQVQPYDSCMAEAEKKWISPKKETRNTREGRRECATPTHLVGAVNIHVLVLVPSTTGQDGWMMRSDIIYIYI
jgi:hypothetical protein